MGVLGDNGHLTTRDLCQIFDMHEDTVCRHVKEGHLVVSYTWRRAFRFAQKEVIRYWEIYLEGRCLRCTIMGEATPEQDFLCGPCAYEVETGRIWWPELPRHTTYGLPQGRLYMKLGGNNGGSPHT